MTKLSPVQCEQLVNDVNTFLDAYIDSCEGSIRIKMSMLLHLQDFLAAYSTICFFAKDAVESLHAIVNLLAHQYAALDTH